MPRLTIGLLNINQAQLTIDMLTKLAHLPAEWQIQLILVDNDSRSEQVRQLYTWFAAHKSAFAEVLFLTASRNLGANGGRNIILKLASGDGILIMDNDLVLPDDAVWLNTLWQTMVSDPEIGIVGPMLVFAAYPDIVQGAGIGLTERGRVGYLHRGEVAANLSPAQVEVVASPAACWLIRLEAQRAVGLFADEFYPMQYWDVDFCVRLHLAGWKVICDQAVQIKHIENVTTRNLADHPYARVAVQHWILFREKWGHVLPQLATITEEEIYWGPIPRLTEHN